MKKEMNIYEMQPAEITIWNMGFHDRIERGLYHGHVKTVEDLLLTTDYEFLSMRDIGREHLGEIHEKLDDLRENNSYVQTFLKEHRNSVKLVGFTTRTQKALLSVGINTVDDIITRRQELESLPNIGKKSLIEIEEKMLEFCESNDIGQMMDTEISDFPFDQCPDGLWEDNPSHIDLCELELSNRSYERLRRYGLSTMKDLMDLSDEEIKKIRGLGVKSCKEICDRRDLYREVLSRMHQVQEDRCSDSEE